MGGSGAPYLPSPHVFDGLGDRPLRNGTPAPERNGLWEERERLHAAMRDQPVCVELCRRICLTTSRGTRSDEMRPRRPHCVRSERSRMSPAEPQEP